MDKAIAPKSYNRAGLTDLIDRAAHNFGFLNYTYNLSEELLTKSTFKFILNGRLTIDSGFINGDFKDPKIGQERQGLAIDYITTINHLLPEYILNLTDIDLVSPVIKDGHIESGENNTIFRGVDSILIKELLRKFPKIDMHIFIAMLFIKEILHYKDHNKDKAVLLAKACVYSIFPIIKHFEIPQLNRAILDTCFMVLNNSQYLEVKERVNQVYCFDGKSPLESFKAIETVLKEKLKNIEGKLIGRIKALTLIEQKYLYQRSTTDFFAYTFVVEDNAELQDANSICQLLKDCQDDDFKIIKQEIFNGKETHADVMADYRAIHLDCLVNGKPCELRICLEKDFFQNAVHHTSSKELKHSARRTLSTLNDSVDISKIVQRLLSNLSVSNEKFKKDRVILRTSKGFNSKRVIYLLNSDVFTVLKEFSRAIMPLGDLISSTYRIERVYRDKETNCFTRKFYIVTESNIFEQTEGKLIEVDKSTFKLQDYDLITGLQINNDGEYTNVITLNQLLSILVEADESNLNEELQLILNQYPLLTKEFLISYRLNLKQANSIQNSTAKEVGRKQYLQVKAELESQLLHKSICDLLENPSGLDATAAKNILLALSKKNKSVIINILNNFKMHQGLRSLIKQVMQSDSEKANLYIDSIISKLDNTNLSEFFLIGTLISFKNIQEG